MSGEPAFSTIVTDYDRTRLAPLIIEKNYEIQIVKCSDASSSTQRIDLFYEDHRDPLRHPIPHYSGVADSLNPIRAHEAGTSGSNKV